MIFVNPIAQTFFAYNIICKHYLDNRNLASPALPSVRFCFFFSAAHLDRARRYENLVTGPHESTDMRPVHRSTGFSLVEMLLALGILSVLALAAFVLYPKLMVRVHADADKRAMSAGYVNFVQVMRAGGAGQFNRDPNSSDGPLSDNPEALAALLKPMDCSGEWGYLDCRFSSASSGYVDFMSVASCQDAGCSSVGAPYKAFSMRVSLYDMPTDACVALVSGMGIQQTDTGASAVYVIGSDWSYKPIFLNTANVPAIVTACQDPANSNAVVMFDFWPWGDAYHRYPGWGG